MNSKFHSTAFSCVLPKDIDILTSGPSDQRASVLRVLQVIWTCYLLARGWSQVLGETEVFPAVQGCGGAVFDPNCSLGG